MNTGLKQRKVMAWIGSGAAIVAIAVFAGWHFLKKDIKSPNSRVKPLVTKAMKKMVAKASDSLYKISYSQFDVNLDSGYAIISDFKMLPDTAIFNKLVNQKRVPNNTISYTAGKIVIRDIRFNKIQGEQALSIGNMTVTDPFISVINKIRPYNDTAHTRPWFSHLTKSLFTSTDFDAIVDTKIDNIFLQNATFVYINDNEERRKKTAIKNIDISISNVVTDALANKDASAAKQSIVKIGRQRILTADKLYYVDLNDIRLIPADKKIYVGSFALTPTLTKAEFSKAVKAGRANYRYHLKSTGITMSDIDFDKVSRRFQFYIPNVTIENSWAEYYTNYKWPLRTPPNRRDKYPHEQLQKLAFDVTIKKMQVKHADMYFKIVAEKTGREAFFSMNNVRSVYTNITNNTAAKNRNPFTTIQSSFLVMNSGKMNSKYKLNLTDKNGAYSVSSTLGPMNGTVYNPLSEPLAMVQIKSLQIEKMMMDMKADEYQAKGNIKFYYNDYKVKLLKNDGDDSTLKKRAVVSLFSNVVLPDANPNKNGKFREGPINVVRDPRESFFGFQWRATLDGLSSAMTGFDQNKEKPENKVTRMGKLFFGPDKGQENRSTGGDKQRLKKLKGNKKDE